MNREKSIQVLSGWGMLVGLSILLAVVITFFITGIQEEAAAVVVMSVIGFAFFVILATGFFVVNPNASKVLLLFGDYKGTVKKSGFHWTNPFMTKKRVSLRARNLNGEKLKVNDAAGNPIEIAAVVVWKVRETAQALFDVDDFVEYVAVQSESAVRHMSTEFPYDGPADIVTLRGSTGEVNERLHKELQERVVQAGVEVLEARLSHLAYAPEIASAMLQRQQAAAIVAARTQIVEGAVGMVEQALRELERDDIVHLDEDKKATMVSNLLVVLCSDHSTSPVVNVGSLYQ